MSIRKSGDLTVAELAPIAASMAPRISYKPTSYRSSGTYLTTLTGTASVALSVEQCSGRLKMSEWSVTYVRYVRSTPLLDPKSVEGDSRS